MRHINIKNISILFAFLFLFALGYYFVKESKKEYIGGNVLHLTYFTEAPKGNSSIAPAWVNNGQVYHFLFDPLVLANHDMTSFAPRIAQSYEILENGLVYKFVIKNNLKWSDGENLTIDDVLFSLNLARSLPAIGRLYDSAFAKIINLEAVNNTLVITLNDTHSGFLVALSQFLIFPKHILSEEGQHMPIAEFWQNPIGSGMYALTEKNDAYYTLEQNPHYTGKKPHIETILLHKDPNVTKDCYLAANISDMENLRNMRGFAEHLLPVPFYRYFVFNIAGDDGHTNPPMQDINIRNAIAKSIDNIAIIKNMYSNILSASSLRDVHLYDPEGAKKLIANSTYDMNRPLRIGYYYTNSNSIYFVKSVGKYLEDVGFKVEYIVENSLEDFYKKRHFDILFDDISILNNTDWHAEVLNVGPILFGTKGKHDLRLKQILQTQDVIRQQELINSIDAQFKIELYRYPVLSLKQAVYLNTERLHLPSKTKLGNPYHIIDINIEDWEIKKQ